MKKLALCLFLCLTAAAGLAEETPELSVPDPVTLKAGWWSYFSTEDRELQAKRYSDVLAQLKQRVEKLPENQRDGARGILQRLEQSLEALAAEAPAPDTTIIVPLLAESYTVTAYMDLARVVRASAARKIALNDEVAQLSERARVARRRYDVRFADYLAAEATPSAQRLLDGLNLMLLRANLTMETRRIDELNETVKQLTTQNDSLRDILDLARKRVQRDESQLGELAKRIEEMQSALNEEKQQSLPLKVGTNGNGGTAYEAILASENLAGIRLLLAEMMHAFAAKEDNLERSVEWSKQIGRFENLAEGWRNYSTSSLVRLSRQPGDVPTEERDHVIKLLNLAGELDEELFVAKQMLLISEDQRVSRLPLLQRLIAFAWRFQSQVASLWDDWDSYPILVVGEAELPITLWTLFKVAMVFLVTMFTSRSLRHRLRVKAAKSGGLTATNFYAFGRMFHYALLSLAVIISLSIMGLPMSTLLVMGGALGIGVGFGLQGIVNNFVSGLTILFEKNFRIGDYIRLPDGEIGEVKEINTQSTIIHTFHGIDVIVPNGQLITLSVSNWTLRDPFLRLHIKFSVAYGTDPDLVRQVVLEAAFQFEQTLQDSKRSPQVWMTELADSGMNFELVTWVNVFKYPKHNSTRAAYLEAIEQALVANGITIPFPQRDIHIKSGTEPALET